MTEQVDAIRVDGQERGIMKNVDRILSRRPIRWAFIV